MKIIFRKILLVLSCIAILGSINKITPSLSEPDTTTIVTKESFTQIQPSVLCITPYFDDFPFDH